MVARFDIHRHTVGCMGASYIEGLSSTLCKETLERMQPMSDTRQYYQIPKYLPGYQMGEESIEAAPYRHTKVHHCSTKPLLKKPTVRLQQRQIEKWITDLQDVDCEPV